MPSDHASAELLHAVSRLHGSIERVSLNFDTEDAVASRATRGQVLDQLADYVLPRLIQLEAPLLAVVGGSTGTGKSTLVNSLVGQQVTEAGVLRPTTRSPVLVYNPADAHWFQDDNILPELPRTTSAGAGPYALRLASSENVPQGLAILDAPDVDSIDAANRELASQLLAAADLWLFVTSAARYADQVPWGYLRSAAERSTSVAVVLDRTRDEAAYEVRGHLARMMTSRGLSDSPLFTVPESDLGPDGLLPREAVADIVRWLHELAANVETRTAVVNQTLDGAIRNIVFRAHDVGDGIDSQIALSDQLLHDARQNYSEAAERVDQSSSDGSMMWGQVLATWQDFVGTGELMRSVDDRVGRMRDRIVQTVAGRRTRAQDVSDAIVDSLNILIFESSEDAAEKTVRSWNASEAGRSLVGSSRGLDRSSHDLRGRAERAVREWQQGVVDVVRSEGADKRMTANFLTYGVNGIAVALMIVMLSHRGGEDASGTAGGTTEIGRSLLDAIFGEENVQKLVVTIHSDFQDRVETLFKTQERRYLDFVVDPAQIRAAQAELRDAAQKVDYARHSDFLEGI